MSDQPSQNTERTVQCLLKASEDTLKQLWTWMQQTTELINNLLQHIQAHPDWDKWLSQGGIPPTVIDSFIKAAKQEPPYSEMPSRFPLSAQNLVKEMYQSWFEVQRRKRFILEKKQQFLAILKSDEELQAQSGVTFNELCQKAGKLLKQTQEKLEKERQQNNQPSPTTDKEVFQELSNVFYPAYDTAKTPLKRCIIALLIKNNYKIPQSPEDPQKYAQRRKSKEIYTAKLQEQLNAKTPKGRRINFDDWFDILDKAQEPITEVKDFRELQAEILRKFFPLSYPVSFPSNTDLTWFINSQGRIVLKLHGMIEGYDYEFEIQCDRRQLPIFQRFVQDSELYRQHKKHIPTGLMLLRSARLVWTEGKAKDPLLLQTCPWNIHHLHLHCSIDTRLWTEGGTEIVKAQKIAQTKKAIDNFETKEKLQENGLSPQQQSRLKSNQTSLKLLENHDVFTPVKKPIYQGNPNIVLGASIGLEQVVTIAIIDISTLEVQAYRKPRQLLSKKRKVKAKQPPLNRFEEQALTYHYQEITDYQRFVALRQKKHRRQHERHKAQRRGASKAFQELHEEAQQRLYINRLFALEIIEIAQQYQVSTIILPDLKYKREIIQCEMQVKAELKFPKQKELQEKYINAPLTQINEWNYAQLSECIRSKAISTGINIEVVQQATQGDFYHKARELVYSFITKQKEASKVPAQ
ncbi:type V CRISPR-associated protein Cas12k [Chroococcus sp. FPU101]|uniref:type V CRISPR-associated protein Cas12k n=1 Tax=Chroococcus sp. FPU101 TaxID=1974212 RepID=UPI001A8C8747|nr:type V CRISPR-associated protein Cas12k [Chroococcus sp. FPU101]GFE68759.1 hypothetical protein CFPU101_13690 [Chroococcus sp. FPU101]